MNTKILTLSLILSFQISFAQINNKELVRYIEVTGSAEMEVDPDEIRFEIGIQEYWAEEFEPGMEYKDYVTKIPIEKIENEFMNELKELGVQDEQIILENVGRQWRSGGKDFRKSKSIIIIIKDFNQINQLLLNVKTRGVNYMQIAELKNKDITEFRKKVKIEAIKAAKEKATYLLESLGDSIGQVISVVEINSGDNNYYWKQRDNISNTIISSSGNDAEDSNIRKIKLRYEVKVSFEIN